MLFTPAERSFLGVINFAINDEAVVFGKVRVADVITPRKSQSRTIWQKSSNKISSKHFDFVICDKEELSPICIIELDDKSHETKKRKIRDQLLRSACESAGVPLLQFPAQAKYRVAQVRSQISHYIPQLAITYAPKLDIALPSKKAATDKLCAKCSSIMIIKIAKKGTHKGKRFWACTKFPDCNYIVAHG